MIQGPGLYTSDFSDRIDPRLVDQVILFLSVRKLKTIVVCEGKILRRFDVTMVLPDGTIDSQTVLDCNWRRVL